MRGAWFVLGFTYDDVFDAGQDWRLAEECMRAWRAAGRPPDFQILEAAGEGEHILVWLVNDLAARVLDHNVLGWRVRIVGERSTLPANTSDVLRRSLV
jgi:hypothetical protein